MLGLLLGGACLGQNITGFTITNGVSEYVNGAVTGAPKSITNGESMFRNAHLEIDLRLTTLSGPMNDMFYNATGTVNIDQTAITNGTQMFRHFGGTVVGAFRSIDIGENMFESYSGGDINLSSTIFSLAAPNMFNNANGTVNIDQTVIKNGASMFENFHGTVTGAPASIDIGISMFELAANVDIVLSSTVLTGSMEDMFEKANGFVNIDQTNITDGVSMFENFHGKVTGAPALIRNGNHMFDGAAHVNINLTTTTGHTNAMFYKANGTVGINQANITNGASMFRYFGGTVSGAPAAIHEFDMMFLAADVDIVLSNTELVGSGNMFVSSTGTVDINQATIANGKGMFYGFLGTVIGTPATIGDGELMFEGASRVEIGLSMVTGSAYRMFKDANGTVNLTLATIANGTSMFENFHGTVTWAPASIADGENMFRGTDNIDINLAILTGSAENMFNKANGTVSIKNATIANGESMFKDFYGNVTGSPASIENGKNMFQDCFWVDIGLSELTGSTENMFNNANGMVDINNATIANGESMFQLFTGNVTGAPASIDNGKNMFFDCFWVDIGLSELTGSTENMFAYANGIVDLNNVTIANGESMFLFFSGNVTGAPTSIENGKEMFWRVYNVDIDLSATILIGSTYNMFYDANGTVKIDRATITNSYRMFYEADVKVTIEQTNIKNGTSMFQLGGVVTGAPASIENGTHMFEGASDVNINLSATILVGSMKRMFVNANGLVNIEQTTITNGNSMFMRFGGILAGSPVMIENGWMMFSMLYGVDIDLSATELMGSMAYMFYGTTGTVNIEQTTITNGNSMFMGFIGFLVGSPVSIANGDSMFGIEFEFGDDYYWDEFQKASEFTFLSKIDLRGTIIDGDFVTGMFAGSTVHVLLEGAIIQGGENLFKDFKGTTSGGPFFTNFSQLNMGAFTATDFFSNTFVADPNSVFPDMTFLPMKSSSEKIGAGAIAGIVIGALTIIGIAVKIGLAKKTVKSEETIAFIPP
jgi:hypothetical protein